MMVAKMVNPRNKRRNQKNHLLRTIRSVLQRSSVVTLMAVEKGKRRRNLTAIPPTAAVSVLLTSLVQKQHQRKIRTLRREKQ